MPVEATKEDRVQSSGRSYVIYARKYLVELMGIFPYHMPKSDPGHVAGKLFIEPDQW